jgi:hypothetical protein
MKFQEDICLQQCIGSDISSLAFRQTIIARTAGSPSRGRPQRFQDTGRSPDTAASRLGGVHKLDVLYSARREPRARAQT